MSLREHTMIFGLSHIDIPVSDLPRSRRLYVETLGFSVKKETDEWCDLDTGTVIVRLAHTRRPESRVTIRVQSADIDGALQALVSAGARPLYEAMRTPDLELIGAVSDFDGHTIIVRRELSEDEYDFVPELPKELVWDPEADVLLKSLLQVVPALFRALARRKVAKNAEFLCRERGKARVERDDVVRSYIISSAKITRYRVRDPLIKHGYNPDNYAEEFDS